MPWWPPGARRTAPAGVIDALDMERGDAPGAAACSAGLEDLWYAAAGQENMTDTKPCVFCGVVAGSEPASIVYEDDQVMAFPGLRQTRPGELMLIPKQHIDEFCDTPDELAAHMAVVANRLSRATRSVFRPQRMGLVVHGFGVPHVHLILLPQHEPSDIISGRHAQIEDGKIVYSERGLPIWSRERLDEVAEQIRVELTKGPGKRMHADTDEPRR